MTTIGFKYFTFKYVLSTLQQILKRVLLFFSNDNMSFQLLDHEICVVKLQQFPKWYLCK